MSNWERETRNGLMIVDCSNLAFRFFSRPLAMETGLLNTIQSLKVSYGAKDVIVLFDMGMSTYRVTIDPEYKATRTAKKGERTEEEKEKWEHFFECQEAAMRKISEAGIPVIQEYGLEADDVAAYLCREKYDNYDEIKLISTDKDWLQLLDEKITCFAYVSQEERDLAWMAEKYECTPEQFLRALILSGDSSDNIIGIVGLGEPKHARARSLTWARKGETLEGVIDMAGTVKGVIAQRIVDGRDTIMLAEKLVDLNQPNILTATQIENIEKELDIYGIVS